AAFADSVATQFGLVLDEPIEYYVAPTVSEMARISGLDYSWDPNDGRAYVENRQVFVGTGREDYLHELAHALFGPLGTVHILDEGLATYLGGFGTRTFEEAAADTAARLRTRPELRFDDVLRGTAPDFETYYVTGAVLVKAALAQGGPDALRRFLTLARTPDRVYEGLSEVLGVSASEADSYWRQLVFFQE
ncbi:MAG: hypothetical protein AAGI71_15630, partial [Bacteroidota bacterium]